MTVEDSVAERATAHAGDRRHSAGHPRPGLPHAVGGERREITGRAGLLSYYVAGSGSPLLLVHSVNAAASAYEVRPVFERMRRSRRVYALDLPGYGFSDRSDRRYDVRLFTDSIHDMLDEIAADSGDEPVDALAVSLGCEFLARVATERPERLRRLVMVTPTGFSRGAERLRGPSGASREVPGVYRTVSFALWGKGLFDLLVSKPSVRFFLRKTFGADDVDEHLVDYDYATAHQPGARHAPFAFLSARLFSRDIRTVYEALTLPIWMPHGTRGDFRDFSEAGWAKARPNWRVQPYGTGALPHFQEPQRFIADLEAFLGEAEPQGSPSPASSPRP